MRWTGGTWNKPLIQHNKKRARFFLYSIPIFFFVMTIATAVAVVYMGIEAPWLYIDYESEESVRLFREYLRIDTSFPTGNEIAGAEFLARELKRLGLEPEVHRLGHRNAAVWATLEGRETGALALHSHMDVDPIKDLGSWQYPPFSPYIELPFIIGRGAFDMKSLAIAQLMAVKELVESGETPRRSVVFLATGDEEHEDSRLGTRWFIDNYPQVWNRFELVLTEGGAIEAIDPEEIKYWGTETIQKRYLDFEICSSNLGALEGLRNDMANARIDVTADELPEEIVEYLRDYVSTRARDDLLPYLEAALVNGAMADLLPANVRDMMSHRIAVGPVTLNPNGGGYKFIGSIHLLPWASDDVLDELLPDLSSFGVTIDTPHGPLPFEGLESEALTIMGEIVGEAFPGVTHGPLFVPWAATDSRYFRSRGIQALGFSPFVILSTDAAKITGPNERMVAPAFLEGVELYTKLVQRLVE